MPPSLPQQSSPKPQQKHGAGPLIGIIVILVVILAGALYLWGATLNRRSQLANQIPYIESGTTTIPASQ